MLAEDYIISRVLRLGGFKSFTPCEIGSGVYSIRLCFHPGFVKPVAPFVIEVPFSKIDNASVRRKLSWIHQTTPPFVRVSEALEPGYLAVVRGSISHEGKRIEKELELRFAVGAPGIWRSIEAMCLGCTAGHGVAGELVFPTDVAAMLKGGSYSFAGVLQEVMQPKYSVPDSEWAKELGHEGIEQFNEYLKSRMEKERDSECRDAVNRALIDKLEQIQEIQVPAAFVENEMESLLRAQRDELLTMGIPQECLGEFAPELKAEFANLAKRRARTGVIVASLAAQNRVIVTASELDANIAKRGAGGRREEERLSAVAPMLEKKTITKILEKCEIKLVPVVSSGRVEPSQSTT